MISAVLGCVVRACGYCNAGVLFVAAVNRCAGSTAVWAVVVPYCDAGMTCAAAALINWEGVWGVAGGMFLYGQC